MEDIILKLHVAVMLFANDRIGNYRNRKENGFTTAELLGNAALGIAALAAIWGVFRTELGPWIMDEIKRQISGS